MDKSFDYDFALKNSNLSVLLYFHGKGEDRSNSLLKYDVLRLLFHVITFDYRSTVYKYQTGFFIKKKIVGFADSTEDELSEDAVVKDCVQLFNWLHNKTNAPIFFWGHSLGTAIATKTAALLKNGAKQPVGLVLEAPFTSMKDELYAHPLAKVHIYFFTIT